MARNAKYYRDARARRRRRKNQKNQPKGSVSTIRSRVMHKCKVHRLIDNGKVHNGQKNRVEIPLQHVVCTPIRPSAFCCGAIHLSDDEWDPYLPIHQRILKAVLLRSGYPVSLISVIVFFKTFPCPNGALCCNKTSCWGYHDPNDFRSGVYIDRKTGEFRAFTSFRRLYSVRPSMETNAQKNDVMNLWDPTAFRTRSRGYVMERYGAVCKLTGHERPFYLTEDEKKVFERYSRILKDTNRTKKILDSVIRLYDPTRGRSPKQSSMNDKISCFVTGKLLPLCIIDDDTSSLQI